MECKRSQGGMYGHWHGSSDIDGGFCNAGPLQVCMAGHESDIAAMSVFRVMVWKIWCKGGQTIALSYSPAHFAVCAIWSRIVCIYLFFFNMEVGSTLVSSPGTNKAKAGFGES
jgi:hypothetical protein